MSENTEEALWVAVRSLEEKAMLHKRLATLNSPKYDPEAAAESEKLAAEAKEQAKIVHGLIGKISK